MFCDTLYVGEGDNFPYSTIFLEYNETCSIKFIPHGNSIDKRL